MRRRAGCWSWPRVCPRGAPSPEQLDNLRTLAAEALLEVAMLRLDVQRLSERIEALERCPCSMRRATPRSSRHPDRLRRRLRRHPAGVRAGRPARGAAGTPALRPGPAAARTTPPPHPRTGRPPRHGREFALGNPATWPQPQTTTQTTRYGTAAASSWDRLHPRLTHRTCWLDHQGELPVVEGTLIRLQVDHLPGDRDPKPVWLWSSPTGATAADVDRWWRCFLRRFDLEIVCTQVTKPRLGAAWCGRDHIADLHLAVGDHHPVDQQLHQLAALLEASLAEPRARPLQHLGHRPGGRAYLDQSLTLGGDLSLAGQQVRLLPGKGPVLALEAGQVDHLGQVGLQQALPLACHARPDTAQGRLPAGRNSWGTQAPLYARSNAWATCWGCCKTAHRSAHTSSSSRVAGLNRAGQGCRRPEATCACLPRQR